MWGKKGYVHHPKNTSLSVKQGGGSVMDWALHGSFWNRITKLYWWWNSNVFIHPSILGTTYTIQVLGEPGVYPKGFGAKGGGHPGQVANPSQATITHHHSNIMDNIEMSISLCIWIGRGNRCTQKLSPKMKRVSTGQGWDLSPQPQRYGVKMQTTKKLCPTNVFSI